MDDDFETPGPSMSRELRAGFDSECGCCFGQIFEGDLIKMCDGEALCEECWEYP